MLIAFSIFLLLFILLIEIVTVLFRLTEMQEEKARFQVISILTGTGFTTKESELITQHPRRRNLAQAVMILGYAGSITFTSFIINILIDIIKQNISLKEILITGGLALTLLLILKNKKIILFIDNIIEKTILKNRIMKRSVNNVYKLLNKSKGYGLYNILIETDSKFIGKTLQQSEFKEKYNIQILNIDKGHELINQPDGNYVIEKGDNLLVYGRTETIIKMFHL